ncbi:MAG: hypothetical protein FWG98_08210 [Candidatus Cloacimonetes bacterium]|nr:hypothetical protein [Candidatus Cloacimonadota bacterium]
MTKYHEYFDIDEKYFPAFSRETADSDPEYWEKTYPHEVFIDMLKVMAHILDGKEARSMRIEGSFGTGKSRCVYALKRILEIGEEELKNYWNKFDALKDELGLLKQYIGLRKNNKIITVYRQGSGGLSSPVELAFEIYSAIREALENQELFVGGESLRGSWSAWIEKNTANSLWLDNILSQHPYKDNFTQVSAAEVLEDLKSNEPIESLLKNLINLNKDHPNAGIKFNIETLKDWITEVIDVNKIKIVFLWDEFTAYLNNNSSTIDQFESLVQLFNSQPFYLVPVTQGWGHNYSSDNMYIKRVEKRFMPIKMEIPEHVAFLLIGEAIKVNDLKKGLWIDKVDTLHKSLHESRKAVMSETKLTDEQIFKNILPLHPMAVYTLKYITEKFQQNERSMFDFIKSQYADKVHSFQWFIKEFSPEDEYPLLTVDLLWDFFSQSDGLLDQTSEVLKTFYQNERKCDDEEKKVLKAILIMQALNEQYQHSMELFRASDKNLKYVFQGTDIENNTSKIAHALMRNEIIISEQYADGKSIYKMPIFKGDQKEIKDKQDELEKIYDKTPSKMLNRDFDNLLTLTDSALNLRYEITTVTTDNFMNKIRAIKSDPVWQFKAVIAIARDKKESETLRLKMKENIPIKEYSFITFIDATETYFFEKEYAEFLKYDASTAYYQGKNDAIAGDNKKKAEGKLTDWKNSINEGKFIVYSPTGESETIKNKFELESKLKAFVGKKFKHVFDFKGVSGTTLKIGSPANAAFTGVGPTTKGSINEKEITKLFPISVWKDPKFWENPYHQKEPITIIKKELDKFIIEKLRNNNKVSFSEIYEELETNYGFPRCDLSIFLTAFLLKDYVNPSYRHIDQNGHPETMSAEKLISMVSGYFISKNEDTTMAKISREEEAFYDISCSIFDIPKKTIAFVDKMAYRIEQEMKKLQLPIWSLSEICNEDIYTKIQYFIDLIQESGGNQLPIAIEIGKMALEDNTVANNLKPLLKTEKCKEGLKKYFPMSNFSNIWVLAASIHKNEDDVWQDIASKFAEKHSTKWDKEMGEEALATMLLEYQIIKETNQIFNTSLKNLFTAFQKWQESLKTLGISHEKLENTFEPFKNIIGTLLNIHNSPSTDILKDNIQTLFNTLRYHSTKIKDLFNNPLSYFKDMYSPYLENLREDEVETIRIELATSGLFALSETASNTEVRDKADEKRKSGLRTSLLHLWKEKTDTINPFKWSDSNRIPILCCIPEDELDTAKQVFELYKNIGSDQEIEKALKYLEVSSLFETITDPAKRDQAFIDHIIGEYHHLIKDIENLKDKLDNLHIPCYEWFQNKKIEKRVKQEAEAQYFAGGSDKILSRFEEMDEKEVKKYFLNLIKKKMVIGLGVLTDE